MRAKKCCKCGNELNHDRPKQSGRCCLVCHNRRQFENRIKRQKIKPILNLKNEKWCPIQDFPRYRISDMGRIVSIKKYGNAKLLKQTINKRGYLNVHLCNDKENKCFLVSRLVGIHFIPNPLNLPEINHKKGIKLDNRATELEWCTNAQNIAHSCENGLNARGEKHGRSILTELDVLYIFNSQSSGNDLALEFGVAQETISQIKTGRSWNYLTKKEMDSHFHHLSENEIKFIRESKLKIREIAEIIKTSMSTVKRYRKPVLV